MNPTDEQIAIYDRGRQTQANIMISALAGCGKTSTLEQLDKIVKQKPCLYLVFNKRNAEEATERMQSTTTVRTFNGLGHRIWASAIGRQPNLNPKKTYEIFKEITDEVKGPAARTLWGIYDQVKHGVEIAKAIGYVPEGGVPANAKRLATRTQFQSRLDETPDELCDDVIDAVLRRSIKLSYEGVIDFNDQVYMSALFGGTYPKFPLTLVDEYQDLNPVNHEMIRKLVGNRRLIGVGDPHQNIYGFRGAKSNGMAEATTTFSMAEMNLSISFRCPEKIVRNSHWLVPHFRWFKKGGHVESLRNLDAMCIDDSAVIICRLNAPLFALAFKLISIGRGVTVMGSDIGPRIIAQMKKFGDGGLSQSQVLGKIGEWLEIKLAKESKTAQDSAECMRVFARHGSTLNQAISYAEHLFAQRGSIHLMSGHKSKGAEFSTVYHLDPQLIGSHQQDRHIRYVIGTRSSDRYFEIRTEDIQWAS